MINWLRWAGIEMLPDGAEPRPSASSPACLGAMWRSNSRGTVQPGPVVLWISVGALAFFDAAVCQVLGLTFTHWFPFLPVALGIAGIGLFYRLTGRDLRIAAMANWVLLWLVFSLAGSILSYAAAARGAPWWDAEFAAFDRALGLDWIAWATLLAQYPLIGKVLGLAYGSLMPQIILAAVYFAYTGREEANRRLLLNAFVALLPTLGLFSLMPAVGPFVYFLHAPSAHEFYFDHLQGLHDGTLLSFPIAQMKGIICLPSFHTVLAILLVDACRRSPLLIPAAVLNMLMLVAIPSEGGHYFVDVLAGAAMAAAAIAVTSVGTRWRRVFGGGLADPVALASSHGVR